MRRSRNWRRDKADKLFQEKLLADKPKCLACDLPAQTIHHYHPKSVSNRLRHDLKNGAPLCNGCHWKHHCGDPTVQQDIDKMWGRKRLDYLNKARQEFVKTDVAHYEEIIKQLSEL